MQFFRTLGIAAFACLAATAQIGREVGAPVRLADGQEFILSDRALIDHGRKLFDAVWTPQEGGMRPLTKGTGAPVSDPSSPLAFPRMFNRVSGLDANSCAGCHNAPYGVSGGGGDYTTGVFVLGQRFDFATFDGNDFMPLRGGALENGQAGSLQTASNFRATPGMYGAGYIELLAREMTADLQAQRDALQPGHSVALLTKDVTFGTLRRNLDGTWYTADVRGLPTPSLATTGASAPPSLIIRPFHQVGNVISLRQFTNNAYNHHHGIQTIERFGAGTDPDGDTFQNEMSRADVTAVALFQATLPVPGRIIPNDPAVEAAVLAGEEAFASVGCTECHRPTMPLNNPVFSEPNPYNPPGNLLPGQVPQRSVNLNTSSALPRPRLRAASTGVTYVPAFTDLKIHDICSGPTDPNIEKLNQNAPAGSAAFFAGNSQFLTKKLWGAANEPPYFHHGQFATLRQAIAAHAGEALASRQAFDALSNADKDGIIEFLKTLKVLPPGTKDLIVDEDGKKKNWPPN